MDAAIYTWMLVLAASKLGGTQVLIPQVLIPQPQVLIPQVLIPVGTFHSIHIFNYRGKRLWLVIVDIIRYVHWETQAAVKD